ncbi:hypothetical protein DERF_005117 [Dermatophagoides farinae]|nr:hypothetical protein HUG17_7639 [Dermatophagoides farinae]KAH9521458.1 hypothetical protein DERF_005117 [Dermatophagoides farinae]KAH9521459.1 hypothetical protein DERF_005117 [Dermatophagoides farinae]
MANELMKLLAIISIIIVIIFNYSSFVQSGNVQTTKVGSIIDGGIIISNDETNELRHSNNHRIRPQSNDTNADEQPCDPTVNQCMDWCGETVRRPGKCPNGQMCCVLIY